MITEYLFEDQDTLTTELCQAFTTHITEALKRHDKATLLLSGGSTPQHLYLSLSSTVLPWNKVDIALVDERWVDAEHSASNEGLIRKTLLINQAQSAHFLGMKTHHETASAAIDKCNEAYSLLSTPYTLCLLGMGPDGHTASLFPHAPDLEDAFNSTQHCTSLTANPSKVTGTYLERMTMTPWSILQSKKIILLFTGDEKWQVYQQARLSSSPQELPLSLFLQQSKVDIDVYWSP